MNAKARVQQQLLEAKDEMVAFLQKMVQTDTRVVGHGILGGYEKNGQELILERLQKLNVNIDVFEPDNEKLDRYKAANRGHKYQDRANVVAVRKGSGGGRSLILNGHIDTMPYGEHGAWSRGPFSGEIENGILHGLGSADMKVGTIGFLMAFEMLERAGISLKGDLIFESVVDEEGGGNGTLACIDRGYVADGAIISEPTSLEIQPTHMGFLFYKVEVTGKSLHSSRKWRGVNAIDKAFLLINALYELERKWMMIKKHPLLPPPTLNIGEIHGGSAGSTVPSDCYFTLCLHYLPEDADEEGLGANVEREILDTLNLRCQGDEWLREHPPTITRYQEGSPFETPIDHLLIETTKASLRKVGVEPAITGMPAGCDARYFVTPGNTPCVIVGPGHPEQAHAIDEHVSVNDYLKFIAFTCDLIMDWCGWEENG